MNKKDRVTLIINQIREQADELLENEIAETMTAEEIVVLSTELSTHIPVTRIEYTQPVGTVDRNRVTVMLGDDIEFPLFGDEYYEDEP